MPENILNFLLFLLRYLKKNLRFFFLGLFFSIIASSLTGIGTWSIKPLFNYVFIEKHYEFFKFVPLYLILLFFLIGIFSLFQAYYMKALSTSIINTLRLELFNKCLNLPYRLLQKERSGQTISKVINDTAQIEPVLGEVSQILIKETLTVLILFGVAFYQRWDLTLLALITLPIIIFGTKHLGSKARRARRLTQISTGELTHRMGEIIYGLREIKLAGSKEVLLKFFAKELERFYRLSLKVTKYREASKSLVDIATGIGGAIIISYGGYLILTEKMSPGAFLSIMTAILLIFNPLRKLTRAYTSLKEAQGIWVRLEEVLSLEGEKGGSLSASSPEKGFSLKGVYFKYDENLVWALKGINLEIPANRLVALVGPSGAGKSTLVSLLLRLYDPTEGEIFLDHYNLKEFNLESLRGLFGMVWQDPFLFNLSIWENLILAKPTATKGEVIEACKLAQALEFIEKLPKGFDTVLGEEGINLSGGQKQRIALARVFLKRPPVIILDEATSQLDTLTERAIESALNSLKGKHTLIVIAHRLSTIVKADKIIVMEKGKIVAEGTHRELLKSSYLYNSLYQSFVR